MLEGKQMTAITPELNLISAAIQKLPGSSANLNGQKNDKTSIFYINDIHGKSINAERTIAASKIFDSFSHEGCDVLKLSSGDIQLGEPLLSNRVMVEAQNIMGITASAMGNHEYDTPSNIKELIPHMGYKLLACNIKIKEENPLSKKVEKSFIQEVNGTKYGIIGVTPIDLFSRIKHSHIFEELKIDKIDDTIKDIQQECDKLKAQGVNKIILLSHAGFSYDKRIARETDGIDIILGGHSHELITDVKPNYNLFNSKSGEPVVITQAGRDGRYFGILNVEWDKNGIIRKLQNNVSSTRPFKRNPVARYLFEKILGKPKIIGEITSAPPPPENGSTEPSAHTNFLCDCMKDELNTDIALFGAATMRGYFEPGILDSRWLEDISPFKNNLAVVNYTEKEIVDALKISANSLVSTNNKPGILHVSGLKYDISKDGKLLNASFIDKYGNENPIDIKNPRTDKLYKTALIDFYAEGHDGFTMLKKIDKAEKIYDYDICKCVENYFAHKQKPVEIIDDKRIKIV